MPARRRTLESTVLRAIGAAVFLLLLCGCYELPFTAGLKQDASFDPEVLGTWRRAESPGVRPATLVIEPDRELYWYNIQYSEPGKDVRTFRAIVHFIAGRNIISLKTPPFPNYSLFTYELKAGTANMADRLQINLLKVDLEQVNTREEFKELLESKEENELFEQASYFSRAN